MSFPRLKLAMLISASEPDIICKIIPDKEWKGKGRRDEDEQAKKKVKQEFKVASLFQVLDSEDQKLRKIAGDLYESTIDYGGHPNRQAFLSVMKQQSLGSKTTFQSAYMIGNEPALHLCLKSSAQIGTCALSIIRLVFRERFDILGISDELEALKKAL